MELNKISFSQTNNHSIKICHQNQTNMAQDIKTGYSEYSADNIKANYMVNFKGHISGEVSSNSSIGTLNYETHFFREPETDEKVQDYILNNFSDDSEINIVSGACSTGEEAKSYAMMLDSLGDNLQVSGFDISENTVEQANNRISKLLIASDVNLAGSDDFDSEKFLVDDDYDLTPYLKRCKEKFTTYYDKSGDEYKVPAYPDAQKQLDDLNEMMSDKEKYTKAKNDYYAQINSVKAQVANNIDDNFRMDILNIMPSFDSAIEQSKEILEEQRNQYYTYQDYKAKDGSFDNCHFKQGDLLNLENLYEPNSVNCFLYRNALYHTLCQGNFIGRIMRDDAQEKMDGISKQMNKVVKPRGLVVFEKDSLLQMVDPRVIKKSMENNGFEKLVQNGEELDNVWVKVKDID